MISFNLFCVTQDIIGIMGCIQGQIQRRCGGSTSPLALWHTSWLAWLLATLVWLWDLGNECCPCSSGVLEEFTVDVIHNHRSD